MQKPVYHGKTIVCEVDTKHPIDVSIANEGLIIFNTPNVFPEYFFISIPMFDDVINNEIDNWLYVMKHSEIKKGFKLPYMAKVAKCLLVIKMSSEECNEYIYYQKQSQDILNAAENKGIEKVAINMLNQNLDNKLISAVTGLAL